MPWVWPKKEKRPKKKKKKVREFLLWWLVKNPTAAAWVAVELWVISLALCSGLKDLALAWLGFSPWLGNFHMLWVWP